MTSIDRTVEMAGPKRRPPLQCSGETKWSAQLGRIREIALSVRVTGVFGNLGIVISPISKWHELFTDSSHQQICTITISMSNVCIRTHAGARAPLEIGHSYYLRSIRVHHSAVYVTCGYRALEEANIKKQIPDCPPCYIECTDLSVSSSLVPRCHSSGRGGILAGNTFPFFQMPLHKINESR
jgi:hypothetical protein